MTTSGVPDLGRRIRQERQRRGTGLRALARAVGVSASMISQIETGKTRPSVSTLYAITTALGISLDEVFAPAADGTEAAGDGAAPATVAQALRARPGLRLGPHVPPDQRQQLTLETGVTWERLGEIPGRMVDFLRITYPPGGSSSSSGRLMQHPGAEFGMVISGELVLTLGPDELVLRPGDAVSFESSLPHRYRNDGTEPAVGVWFVLERP